MIVGHIAIEPFRSAEVPQGAQVIDMELQNLDLTLFDGHQDGDLLFIDSSHVTIPYGNIITELLLILPRLQPGVIVHFHDVFFPFDYPPKWFLKNMVYTKQWLIALMLYGAEFEWKVLWSAVWFAANHEEKIRSMPNYPMGNQTSPIEASFYIRKIEQAKR